MKTYTMFNYEYLFSDHFAKLSDQARLYYIKLNFYANNGFVANPLQVLDSLNYDFSVFNELVVNGDLLKLPNRSEIFITSYFVHNKGINPMSWTKTPFAPYWKGKLYIKKSNGIATFTPQADEKENKLVDSTNEDLINEIDNLKSRC